MIGKRGGKWWARVTVNGEQRWLGTFGSRREARQAESEAEVKRRPKREETCDSFAERWLEFYPREAPGTQRTYHYAAQRIGREFKGTRMADIDRLEAREWALKTPASIVSVARAMFADALNDGIVVENPFTSMRLKRSRGRKDITALTEAEVHKLASLAGHLSPLIVVAGFTGMRAGELCALEWGDVNLSDHEIRVSRALDRTGKVGPPKNGQPRTIVCLDEARTALLTLPRRIGTDLIFSSPQGKRLSVGTINYHFRQVRREFGKPALTFHELRHACATLLLERGVSHADVALQLGHTDGGRLIQQLYGHPSEDAARERIKAALRPPTPLVQVDEVSERRASS